ncbi:hypothetical protein [Pontiella sp.]|uniref:hypothetical protein n=1 Tax=Pontiella sp. TaxID=2837462 RepID=UPI003568C491
MKRIDYILSIGLVGSMLAAAQTADTKPAEVQLSAEQIQAMEKRVAQINDPAAKLFFQANIHRAKGETEEALKKLAELSVHHAHNKRWITRSELLSAKLYLELGMPEQAEVTARQVEFLNQGTDAAETARLFREELMQKKEQSEGSD